LHNELPGAGNWLLVKLEGQGLNTDAIGAEVVVRAGKLRLLRLVQSGSGYLSQDDMRLHFGLGAEKQADSLEVRWPDGSTTRMEDVQADRLVKIRQPR
ncbi:MAG TPA: ASPIC/UnbV domain-containing protein, partial [Vicinamibacteria bacterium]